MQNASTFITLRQHSVLQNTQHDMCRICVITAPAIHFFLKTHVASHSALQPAIDIAQALRRTMQLFVFLKLIMMCAGTCDAPT